MKRCASWKLAHDGARTMSYDDPKETVRFSYPVRPGPVARFDQQHPHTMSEQMHTQSLLRKDGSQGLTKKKKRARKVTREDDARGKGRGCAQFDA